MEEIKSIETEYNGYRFRSRLEARWAVFFDLLEIEYEYEPEGFVLDDGSKYLPDFYLSQHGVYVEIKSKHDIFIHQCEEGMEFDHDKTKYAYATDFFIKNNHGFWFLFGDPMDAFLTKEHGGGKNFFFSECICLGKHFVSKDPDFICLCDGIETKASKCTRTGLYVECSSVLALNEEFLMLTSTDGIPQNVKAIPFKFVYETLNKTDEVYQLEKAIVKTLNSAKKARQARFEHGEKPIF